MAESKEVALQGCAALIREVVGRGPGSIEQMKSIEAAVRGARLKGADFDALRAEIPAAAMGVTGVRVSRVLAMLKRLEG